MNQLFAQRRNLFRPGHNRLLTHLRYFGYIFNPIPVYYCFNEGDPRPRCYVLEVSNTLFSPFLPMDMSYRCWVKGPGDQLSLSIEVRREQACVLQTNVAMRIHLNALRLWLKGVKPVAHPGS